MGRERDGRKAKGMDGRKETGMDEKRRMNKEETQRKEKNMKGGTGMKEWTKRVKNWNAKDN